MTRRIARALRLVAAALCLIAVSPALAQSPAELKIAAAQRRILSAPQHADAHAALALALTQRARERADVTDYDRAEAAVARALELEPGNLAAERVRVWARLGKHEFAEALALAQALNKRIPDDLMSYAFLVDANAELGNYAAAEEAAQWLLDLRPGTVAGLTRAAYLRELFGDVDGALELMHMASQRLPPAELEDRAWMLTQIAHLEMMRGKHESAEPLLAEALRLFPDYHYALGQLARLRSAQSRHAEAVQFERRRYRIAAHPENLFALGVALKRAGQRGAAQAAFTAFERTARAESGQWDNANRELVFYYVDHARRPSEALRVAEGEFARRKDVHTRDCYAWALHANGRHAQARAEIEQVLAVGIREAGILYRAGAIAAAQRDLPAARRYLRHALRLAPLSELPDGARALVTRLGSGLAKATRFEQAAQAGQ